MENDTSFYATERLREMRMLAGMTQIAFAKRAGVEQSSLSRMERGADGMRPQVAKRICKALGLSIEQAMQRSIITIGRPKEKHDDRRSGSR